MEFMSTLDIDLGSINGASTGHQRDTESLSATPFFRCSTPRFAGNLRYVLNGGQNA